MRYNILLAACISVSVLGCSALPQAVTKFDQKIANQAKGSVMLSINWPQLRTQSLPSRSQALSIIVKKDGIQVGETRLVKKGTSEYVTSGSNTMVRLELDPGTGYTIESNIYDSVLDADILIPPPPPTPEPTVDPEATPSAEPTVEPTPVPTIQLNPSSSHIIATATSAAFEVKSGYQSNVKMTVVRPDMPSIDALTFGGVGRGATFSVTGTNLGSDSTLVSARIDGTYNYGGTWMAQLEVVSLQGNTLTLRVPNFAQTGAGKLAVTVDGAESNLIDLGIVDGINTPTGNSPQIKSVYLNNEQKNVVIEDATLSIPVSGWGGNGNINNVLCSVTVKDKTNANTDVTNTVYSNGQFIFPERHDYEVKFIAGSAEQTINLTAGTLNWGTNPNSAGPTAPYYLSDLINPNKWELDSVAGVVPLSNFYLTTTAGRVDFDKSDFTWEYPSDKLTIDNTWNPQANKVKFKGMDTPGVATVVGHLKYDPNRTFTTSVTNLKLASLNVLYDKNYNPSAYYQESLTALPAGGFTLQFGQKRRVKLNSITHTGGGQLSLDWQFKNGLIWASSNDAAVTVTSDQYNKEYAIIEATGYGTASISLTYSPETDPAKVKTISVSVPENPMLDLTIQ